VWESFLETAVGEDGRDKACPKGAVVERADVETGRKLRQQLWNASRFTLMNLGRMFSAHRTIDVASPTDPKDSGCCRPIASVTKEVKRKASTDINTKRKWQRRSTILRERQGRRVLMECLRGEVAQPNVSLHIRRERPHGEIISQRLHVCICINSTLDVRVYDAVQQ